MNAKQIEMDEKEFEDYLTGLYGDVSICGISYSAGWALRELDPTAFDCALSEQGCDDRWKCGECDTEYDSEEDAEECCKEDEE